MVQGKIFTSKLCTSKATTVLQSVYKLLASKSQTHCTAFAAIFSSNLHLDPGLLISMRKIGTRQINSQTAAIKSLYIEYGMGKIKSQYGSHGSMFQSTQEYHNFANSVN